jgi:hypothetical protein
MLKTLVTFIAATILGALGGKVAGVTGIFVGSLAGMIVGWYVAKRLVPR